MVIRAVSRKVHTAHDITIMVKKAAIRAVVDTKIVKVDTIIAADTTIVADTITIRADTTTTDKADITAVRVDTITVKADMDSKADTVSTMPITIQMQDIRSRNA